ncbi:iron chelate uptake ABC transporter family permease subunit [Candidatus Chloroploca sp. Khr17]|uniref:iron chelate uptake ABC transporter family permease subunit n=1 Tax=Candidatus Chloroploca sp. Khr17 TaxID=2496869 RepID=UPI00196AE045|nr:iron chelate uptake ABC transporter family permease subunit [Candidatus Chloroploca sp. Khr17]
MLGGLGGARWDYLGMLALALALGTLYLTVQARSLNALSVGEETAATLGVDTSRFRQQIFALCALLTGTLVTVSGGIGFVGLMLPPYRLSPTRLHQAVVSRTIRTDVYRHAPGRRSAPAGMSPTEPSGFRQAVLCRVKGSRVVRPLRLGR